MQRLLIFTLTLLMLPGFACDSAETKKSASTLPPAHVSAHGYTVQPPAGWKVLDPASVDNGADLVLTHQNKLFMVIPVEVPAELRSSMPALEVFAAEGVNQLGADVPDFQEVSRSRSKLGGLEAIKIMADGKINGLPSRYILVYTQSARWRYQVVAWSSSAQSAALDTALTTLLDSWQDTSAAGQQPSRD